MHFRDTVRQHFVASIGSAQAAARHRTQLLADFYEYHRSAIAEGGSEEIRAYVLPRRGDVTMVDDTVHLLTQQGVEIGRSVGEFSACGDTFPAGSYSISLAQPRKRLVRTLLDEQVSMDADFLAVIQVLVYVGGILVLVLFGVMMTSGSLLVKLRAPVRQLAPAGVLERLAQMRAAGSLNPGISS